MAGCGEQCEIQICNIRPKGTDVKYGLQNLGVHDDDSFALVVARTYDNRNVLESTTLQVNSPHLLKIFKTVVKHHPAVPANYDVPFQMDSPFQMLFHYWDGLHAAVNLDGIGDEARMHLNLLLGFMKANLGPSKDHVDSMLKADSINYSNLWTIFRPGDLVYYEVDRHPWILHLENTAYEETKRMGKFMEVHCTYCGYDGQSHGQARVNVDILQKKYFAAEHPSKITRLPIFPLAWLKDDTIQERLAERGERFLNFKGVQVKAYNGLARYLKTPPWDFYDPDMDDWAGVWQARTETGRIIIDQQTFKEENNSEGVSLSSTDVNEKSERMLCPPYINGYSLSRKSWCRFYIDNISDIGWDQSALKSLMISEARKSVLEALVLSHVFPGRVRDEMHQKGKGLVMLLHGTPGSGKTMTAESVAEVSRKALVTATIGELNQENIPSEFEKNLKRLLQYATMWKAVVLLDEADVFLEGRSEAAGVATEHNALVAVFLKQLEYFSGIVFLTSNRVLVFDKAMKSRIHLALEYKAPDLELRRQIWEHCLSAVPEDDTELDLEEDVDEFLREELNGREIANCISTARTLARFKGNKLSARHIETVLETRREFDEGLKVLRAKKKASAPAKGGREYIVRRETLEADDD